MGSAHSRARITKRMVMHKAGMRASKAPKLLYCLYRFYINYFNKLGLLTPSPRKVLCSDFLNAVEANKSNASIARTDVRKHRNCFAASIGFI